MSNPTGALFELGRRQAAHLYSGETVAAQLHAAADDHEKRARIIAPILADLVLSEHITFHFDPENEVHDIVKQILSTDFGLSDELIAAATLPPPLK